MLQVQDLEALAEAAIRVVMAHFFETMSTAERASLKNDFKRAFKGALASTQDEVGQEPGISY